MGKSLKNPTLFFKTMKKRDPTLFVTKEDENYDGYSRTCLSSARKQPIILTKSELDNINKESRASYTEAIKYGSDPENPYYYICPRYWCLLSNTSMTADDVKAGKCAKQGVPDKIIPKNATKVPSDAFVYEFNDPKQHHKSGSSEYIYNTPGFITGKHPKGYALPCCFKKPNVNWKGNNIPETDDEEDTDGKGKKKKRQKKTDDNKETLSYIISNETFPIRQSHRFGFLPISVQLFLQINNNDFVTENNPAMIKPNTECLLRYGVEQHPKQSILGSVAELYAHSHGLSKTPTVKELKQIMVDAITLDDFIQYNNSYLVSVFKPATIDLDKLKANKSKYENTQFYKQFDVSIMEENDIETDFLEETIASYENFMDYLISDNSIIDHVYLWDIITSHNDRFIKEGVNLIIMEIVNNDITNDIKIICPTNSQSSKIYDSSKETMILLKRNEFYEPIYSYTQVNGGIVKKKVFYDNPVKNDSTINKNLKNILKIIEKTTAKCAPKPSLPTIYRFKKNIQLNELYNLLKTNDYTILSQIMNYQGKIIGVVVNRISGEPENFVFVPCYPSSTISNMNDIPIKMMDDGNAKIWNTYETTIRELKRLHELTNGEIICEPVLKVMDEKLIVGLLTETNQFVQIDPPYENIQYDNMPIISSTNYIIADKTITSSVGPDQERERMVKMISLESQFYSLFRSTIRQLLNEYEMKDIKANIISIFENNKMIYKKKIVAIIQHIKTLVKDKIIFNDIAEDILMKLEELSCFSSNCGKDAYCIRKENGKCVLVIPKKHLISGHDNENIYFGRIADELLRYKRIRLFMMQPKQYLNITNVEYKINANEFILIQSSLVGDYLKNMVPFNNSSSIVSSNHYNAQPQISQTYSNEMIPLGEQYEQTNINETILNDNIVGCIHEKINVTGNQQSIWKRIFTKSKEIVFKNTTNACSFYVLMYIYQLKYKRLTSVISIKQSIWDGYKPYYKLYKSKILHILKLQGKQKIVQKIEAGESFETIIMSESYYLTDLDIWVFSEDTRLQICLFSAYGLNGINKNISWLMCGNQYKEPCYFIRSPPVGLNAPVSYSVIDNSYKIGSLGEFQTIVQNSISGVSGNNENIVALNYYLKHYIIS